LRSAFALSTRPMMSLLFMNVLGAGMGCWAMALDAKMVARIVTATLYARMWVFSVVMSPVRTQGGLAEGVIRRLQQWWIRYANPPYKPGRARLYSPNTTTMAVGW